MDEGYKHAAVTELKTLAYKIIAEKILKRFDLEISGKYFQLLLLLQKIFE